MGWDSMKRGINVAIQRLPGYYRYFDKLHSMEIQGVSSAALSKKIGISPSLVRKDICQFGGFGQTAYGYNVKEVRAKLGHILGVDNLRCAVMIGTGCMGHALLRYVRFDAAGFIVVAAFEKVSGQTGREISGIPVLNVSELDRIIQIHRPDIAILTPSDIPVQTMARQLAKMGIRGFWNFSGEELALDEPDCFVENVDLVESLLQLSYRIAPGGEAIK